MLFFCIIGTFTSIKETKLMKYNDSSSSFNKIKERKTISLSPKNINSVQLLVAGSCGKSLTYTVEGDKLTIEGNGSMAFNQQPWDNYCKYIKTVELPEGLTSIESNAFRDIINLVSITIPSSVSIIKLGAFYNSTSLQSIVIPEKVTIIEASLFNGCIKLSSVEILGNVTVFKS